MGTEAIQGSGYGSMQHIRSDSAPPRVERYCQNENFIDSVVVPSLDDALPAATSTAGKIINHLTNFYEFIGSAQQELCDNAKISGKTARELAGVASRTAASAAIVYGTGTLAALGVVASGPAVGLGVLVAGGIALVFGPPVAENIANWGIDQIQNALGRTDEWIESKRGY